MLDYIHECQANKPEYIPAYALELQILAGLRRGEIPPIEWSDVNDSCLNINKEQIIVRVSNEYSKQRTVIVKHTKNYVDRSFPMTSDLKDFFSRLKAVTDEYFHGTTHCFPDLKTKSGVITNNIVYSFYVRMCNKLNITICKDMIRGPHSFRRNGITKVSNTPGGNIMIASVLYGNSPQSASSHYYSGVDLQTAKQLLESNQTVTKK
jgi:integrase